MSPWSALAAAFGRGRRVPRRGFTALTSKIGPRTFYKGKGCAPTGRHTSKGRYVTQPWKAPDYVVPDLAGFDLKPYVEHTTAPPAAKR